MTGHSVHVIYPNNRKILVPRTVTVNPSSVPIVILFYVGVSLSIVRRTKDDVPTTRFIFS